eukprot:14976958-Alexandrium_andersonii.AAC.1
MGNWSPSARQGAIRGRAGSRRRPPSRWSTRPLVRRARAARRAPAQSDKPARTPGQGTDPLLAP